MLSGSRNAAPTTTRKPSAAAPIELSPADVWAVHAVTHVFEMRGQTHSGIDWIKNTAPAWSEHNFFAFHNWWHLALFHLDAEDYDSVLEVYDTRIRPAPSRVAGRNGRRVRAALAAAAARCRRRRSLDGARRSWEPLGDDGYYAFNDVHALMAFLATGEPAAGEAHPGRSRRCVAPRRYQRHDEPRCRAADGARTRALSKRRISRWPSTNCSACARFAHRFGGSHAQRDLLQLTTTEAAFRAGRQSLARALVAERLAVKSRSEFNRGLLERLVVLGGDENTRAA